ncbi:MAG: hypothetical protein ACKOBM_06315 [Gammaproteobacteria bacterium]
MLTLDNGQLAVELLDPSADRARFGVRYCTGGYIFQVHDAQVGPLMSGPTYPTSFNWFDGQGIPDAFNLGPLPSRTQAGHALVIGIGLCDLNTRTVLDFCDWSITREGQAIRFETTQALEGRAFTLCRTVSLAGRTVRSTTELANTGRGEVSIRWFPHPFYPQPDSDELVWFTRRCVGSMGPGIDDSTTVFWRARRAPFRKQWPTRALNQSLWGIICPSTTTPTRRWCCCSDTRCWGWSVRRPAIFRRSSPSGATPSRSRGSPFSSAASRPGRRRHGRCNTCSDRLT